MKIALFPRVAALNVWLVATVAASPSQDAVRAYRVAHEQELMAEYREMVASPMSAPTNPTSGATPGSSPP